MSGTAAGTRKWLAKRLEEDPDFFVRMGRKGGAISKRHLSHEEAVALGRIGGSAPKRKRTTKPHKRPS